MVEEEAWNAYPYTKTIYKCPFVEKLYLEIETCYRNDNGEEDNIFDLSGADIHDRTVGKHQYEQSKPYQNICRNKYELRAVPISISDTPPGYLDPLDL